MSLINKKVRRGGFVGFVALLAAAAGCGSSSPQTGGLYVTVKDVSMALIADAVVATDPATDSKVTDALGTVLYQKIPAGFYSVTAVHPSLGAAREPITIQAGSLSEITLVLSKDLVLDAGTGSGSGGSGGTAGSAGAGGTPGTGGRGGSGNDAGVTDAGGDSHDGGAVDPSWTVNLATLTKDSNGVNLTWTSTGGPFTSYKIYRAVGTGSFSIIGILNSPTTLSYRDETPMLGTMYSYRVGAATAANQEVQSNVQTITAGVYIDVASQVERMRVDPTRPYLYLVDKVNNSVHFVNLTTNTVESTIFIGSAPEDLGINQDGSKLFVANFGSTNIGVVDLATRMMAGNLLVDTSIGTWDGNPYRIVCGAGNTLVFTSQDQWNNLKLVNAVTGANLTAVGSLYEPGLAASPDGTRVYAGESGISTATLTRWDISGSTLTQVDISNGVDAFTSPVVVTSQDGRYVFWAGMKFLANNLKSVLGTFSEDILASSPDGSVVVGPTKIHDGTTFAAKKVLPLSTSVMAMSADGKTLYLYDMTSSRIYLYGL
jgi:sugar lactone lactonase YvrE